MLVKLYPHQQKAVDELEDGKILWADVGAGKTITALAYFVSKVCKGTYGDYGSMRTPRDIYVITTAKVRDSRDWEKTAFLFKITDERESSMDGVKLTVDSWNNIDKYTGVKDAFFVFDEQRLVGSGTWTKAFIKIAKHNEWILLTATPGDTWLDYIPVFIANGWYKNRTEFKQRHVVYDTYSKFPKVSRYLETGTLVRYRNKLLVHMPFERHTIREIEIVEVDYDVDLFEKAVKKRWHVFENRPLRDVSELFAVMRRVVNSDESRLRAVRRLSSAHPKLIVFYNFDYELENLRKLYPLSSEPWTELETSTPSSGSSKLSQKSTKSSFGESMSKRSSTTAISTSTPGSQQIERIPLSAREEFERSRTLDLDTSALIEKSGREEEESSQLEILEGFQDISRDARSTLDPSKTSSFQNSPSLPTTQDSNQSSKPSSGMDHPSFSTSISSSRLSKGSTSNLGKSGTSSTVSVEERSEWFRDVSDQEPSAAVMKMEGSECKHQEKSSSSSSDQSQTSNGNGSKSSVSETTFPDSDLSFEKNSGSNNSISTIISDQEMLLARKVAGGSKITMSGEETTHQSQQSLRETIPDLDMSSQIHSVQSGRESFAVAEWNGHRHDPIPDTDRWIYLVQYQAGAEGWNCIDTDAMCFYSLTYSYKNWHQAFGRIDRLNTPFTTLYYYVLKSRSAMDKMVWTSLKNKKSFNESSYRAKLKV